MAMDTYGIHIALKYIMVVMQSPARDDIKLWI